MNSIQKHVPLLIAAVSVVLLTSASFAYAQNSTSIADDYVPPVITLYGYQNVVVGTNSTFVDAGADCTDETDPNPTLEVYSNVNTTFPGISNIQYTCYDHNNNNSTVVERTVIIVNNPLNTTIPAKQTQLETDLENLELQTAEQQNTIYNLTNTINALLNETAMEFGDISAENKDLKKKLERVQNIKNAKKEQIVNLTRQADELSIVNWFVNTYHYSGNVTANLGYDAHLYRPLADAFAHYKKDVAFDKFLYDTGLNASDSSIKMSLGVDTQCSAYRVESPCFAVGYGNYTSDSVHPDHVEIYHRPGMLYSGVVLFNYSSYSDAYDTQPTIVIRDSNDKKIVPVLVDRINDMRQYILNDAGQYTWSIKQHPQFNGTVTVHAAPPL